MNFFIVSLPLKGRPEGDLALALSHIEVQAEKTIPIVAVADSHHLPQYVAQSPRQENLATKAAHFHLTDFVNERQSRTDDKFHFDTNLLARKLSTASANWVVIDFEYGSHDDASRFIETIGQYVFFRDHTENCNFVFLVPETYVNFCVRTLNSTINNVGVDESHPCRNGKFSRLIMHYMMKHAASTMPRIVHFPLIKIYGLCKRILKPR